MKELKLFGKLWPIKISLIYIAIVVIITYITYVIHPFISSDLLLISVLRLITSPFNAYFEKHYLDNMGLAFVILGSAEIYLKAIKKPCVYKKAFVSGILASYILSLLWFLESYLPSTGTSIVASTMLLIAFFYICFETIRIGIKTHRYPTSKLIHSLTYLTVGLISAMFILPFYYGVYIQSNPSWYLHICGAIVFSAFYILFTMTVSRK